MTSYQKGDLKIQLYREHLIACIITSLRPIGSFALVTQQPDGGVSDAIFQAAKHTRGGNAIKMVTTKKRN